MFSTVKSKRKLNTIILCIAYTPINPSPYHTVTKNKTLVRTGVHVVIIKSMSKQPESSMNYIIKRLIITTAAAAAAAPFRWLEQIIE